MHAAAFSNFACLVIISLISAKIPWFGVFLPESGLAPRAFSFQMKRFPL